MVNPFEFLDESYLAKATILCYQSINFVILACEVLKQYQCVTKRQTDGQIVSITAITTLCYANAQQYKKTVLSQGEPRDAAVNFDTYRILQRHRAVSLPQHGFLVGLCHAVCSESSVNKMPCYRKDDCAMRPIYSLYGCSEIFWESLHGYAHS